MASNFKQPGDVLPFIAPGGGVVSGSPYVIGGLFCIATTDADAGDEFQGQVTGCFELTKASGEAWAVGDKLYWDASPAGLTKTSSGNTLVGAASRAAESAAVLGEVRLNGITV